MKIPAIKKLLADYTPDDIQDAYEKASKNEIVHIEVDGDDEGEILTHLYAAQWINKFSVETNKSTTEGLRSYIAMVRGSLA